MGPATRGIVKLVVIAACILLFDGAESTTCKPGFDYQYKDEICYKVTEEFLPESQATSTCAEIGGTLLIIKSAAEQEFLNELLYTQLNTAETVWLGGKRVGTTQEFVWNDGISTEAYGNWADDSPSNSTDECLQMITRHSFLAQVEMQVQSVVHGQWKDTLCTKRNLVVCQSLALMALDEVVQIVVQNRKRLDRIEQNMVPIGFIYVQLPDQALPNVLWPLNNWTEVTSHYAGLFFRAEGGASSPFEEKQEASAPRLSQVQFSWNPNGAETDILDAYVPANGWSGYVMSQHARYDERTDHSTDKEYLRFHSVGGEILPVNTAIRLWQRM